MKQIDISKNFSDVPAGRYKTDGPNSGERFRNDLLVPALQTRERVEVILDGAEGYGSSFLEEAFGGLVRNTDYTREYLASNLIIISHSKEYEFYRDLVLEFISDAFYDKSNKAA